jgi:hypothetical protein
MATQPLHWFTSSYSGQGGTCVEVSADLVPSHGVVPVRDSKRVGGPVVEFGAAAFAGFVADLARRDAAA